jgi:uncharacterized protein YyaL (SSP411 family)
MPEAMPEMLVALDRSLTPPREVIIAGKPDASDTRALLEEVHAHFIPNMVLLLADGGAAQKELASLLPFIGEIRMIDGKATAYVCENYSCQLPTTDRAVVAKLLTGQKTSLP